MLSTTIMGLDLGLAKMGICGLKIRDDEIADVHAQLVTSKPKDFDSDTGRWAYMCEVIVKNINDAYPEIVACEFPYGTKGNGRINAETFAIVRLHCFRKSIPFVPVAQSTLKKYGTGNGHAEKSDLRLQLYKEFGHEFGEDECDAFWLAHLGYAIRYGADKTYRKEIAKGLKDKHLT
jgi:Holliday junction resolvasome RuvABC endonuclease subunit